MTERIPENYMILADGCYYDMNCFRTHLNNNVLVVGTSGSGKTRGIVSPNILQASGSYIIVDPKGNLYRQYGAYLRRCGYQVKKLNFADPGDPESGHYNFFAYMHSEQDAMKIAHILVKATENGVRNIDPFWDDATELLLMAVITYLKMYGEESLQNISNVLQLIDECKIDEEDAAGVNHLDLLFSEAEEENPDNFASRCYRRFRTAAERTLRSILITLHSKLARYDSSECRSLFDNDTVEVGKIGDRKTALFVVVSDSDRSMDGMVNIFFTQAMNELCLQADHRPDSRLPVDVRFIMDDFATNVCISDFPRMIASIRSRGISVMLIIQAESQLAAAYGQDDRTIIGNCDTYVYLGGNDLPTAENVARRADVLLSEILSMPAGMGWIFRRGMRPVRAKGFELETFQIQKMLNRKKQSARNKSSRDRMSNDMP